MLSGNVSKCYGLVGCANAQAQHLPCHPSRHWGNIDHVHANVGEVQLLCVHIARSRGLYENVSTEDIMNHLKFQRGANKLGMEKILTRIGIDVGALQIASFAHMPVQLCTQLWEALRFSFGEQVALKRFASKLCCCTQLTSLSPSIPFCPF